MQHRESPWGSLAAATPVLLQTLAYSPGLELRREERFAIPERRVLVATNGLRLDIIKMKGLYIITIINLKSYHYSKNLNVSKY